MNRAPCPCEHREKHREFACILAPDLPLQALIRAEPDLADKPLAVLAGGSQDSRAHKLLAHVSPAARKRLVRPGMTPVQARSILPSMVIRDVAPGVVHAAHQALVDAAWRFSPNVQTLEPGTIVIDLRGSTFLHPSRAALGNALQTACERLGLHARIGIAGGPQLARVAARMGEDVTVIPPGLEPSILAPHSLDLLQPSEGLANRFALLGLTLIRDLARLDVRTLEPRLGREAAIMHALSRGIDDSPFTPDRPQDLFEESVAFDYTIDRLEPLSFLLGAAIKRLMARLQTRSLACARLRLVLDLDPTGRHFVTLEPPTPHDDHRALLTLLRLSLDQRPPPGPVRGLTLSAISGPIAHQQAELFAPPVMEPLAAATLIARLQALAGFDRVGDAAHARFQPAPASGVPPTGTNRRTARLVLRHLSPPLPLSVVTRDDRPMILQGRGFHWPVAHSAGPWYRDEAWWSDQPIEGLAFDVEVRGQGIFRLWRSRANGQWVLEGVYD